ncbi:MAG TPA: dienelactone hydrolase family protein [Candidatus Dormibacteraeota bacterium]|nr:dienelactone hydrolase family protein [Candidatus Dormibacteraeota bacterium]
MCFDTDSRPPIEPISGGALDGSHISLTSDSPDHASFKAFVARPATPTGAGIVILPDVRGLHPYFDELALRFAERGIVAISIDYFGRTAGEEARGDDFEHTSHVGAARWENLSGDIRAAVAHLRSLSPAPTSLFTTGFCMGGRLSSMSATLGLGLSGAIPFYGWPTGENRNGTPAPAEVADQIECDLLIFYGGKDEGITAAVRDTYDAALDQAHVKHDTIVYPNAPHSFFDRKATEFTAESADAWDRTLAFIRSHTANQDGALRGAPPTRPSGQDAG